MHAFLTAGQSLSTLQTPPQPGMPLNAHAPVLTSQLSAVHGLLSLQTLTAPPTHVPPLHWSPLVHGFASLHGSVLGVWTHAPVAGLQVSSVQPLLSLQKTGWLPEQVPFRQPSTVVQALPSLHAVRLAAALLAHFLAAVSQ